MAFIEPMHCNEPNITYFREMRISSQVLLMLNTALFQPEIQTGNDDKLINGLRNPEHTALFQPVIQTGDEDKL